MNYAGLLFYRIRNISRIRPCHSIDSTKTLVHAIVTSRLDHCNSLLYGLPDYLIQRLQYVMNAAAKVITCKRKFDHVTPLLIELHWLPVRQRIVFKILLYIFKALHGATPTYLTELISPSVPSRALRSADQLILEQPTHKLKLIGLRAFSVCAPYLWNSLPFEIKSSASLKLSLRPIFFDKHIFRLSIFSFFFIFRTFRLLIFSILRIFFYVFWCIDYNINDTVKRIWALGKFCLGRNFLQFQL